MQDMFASIQGWLSEGRQVALASVIRTWGSSPRAVGAMMAVNDAGEMLGSVSGGCVEGAVIEAAAEVIRTGIAQRLHFGVADETAWDVGLACGGEIELIVRLLDAEFFGLQAELAAQHERFATITRISQGSPQFGQSLLLLNQKDIRFSSGETVALTLVERADELMQAGESAVMEEAGQQYFVNVHNPEPVLVVVGGVQIAIGLVSIAKTLGFRTVVVDPRRAFGTVSRFPNADQLVTDWPDEALRALSLNASTAVAVLTHDPKLDDPALMVALASDAFYIGALGSKKTQSQRRARLLAAGLSPEQVGRLHGPIGLDLGGRSPEEIALAIMAEIVQVRSQGG